MTQSRRPRCVRCCGASSGRCGDRLWRRCRRQPIGRRACTSKTRAIRSTRFSIRGRCGHGAVPAARPERDLPSASSSPHRTAGHSTSTTIRSGSRRTAAGRIIRSEEIRIQDSEVGRASRSRPGVTRHSYSKCLDERSFSAQMNSISSSPDISCWRIVRAVNGRV